MSKNVSFICTSATLTRVWSPFKDLITISFGTVKLFVFLSHRRVIVVGFVTSTKGIILAANCYCTITRKKTVSS